MANIYRLALRLVQGDGQADSPMSNSGMRLVQGDGHQKLSRSRTFAWACVDFIRNVAMNPDFETRCLTGLTGSGKLGFEGMPHWKSVKSRSAEKSWLISPV